MSTGLDQFTGWKRRDGAPLRHPGVIRTRSTRPDRPSTATPVWTSGVTWTPS